MSKITKIFKLIIKNQWVRLGIATIIVAIIAVEAFYIGYDKGVKNPETVLIRGVANMDDGKPDAVDFNTFWQSWKILKEKYIDTGKIDNQTLVYGAISGLFDSLKDPNTVFMPPSDAKKFNEEISGEFSGVGMEIGIRNEQLVIISPLKDTPAEQAGLKAGDKIIKIDDKVSIEMAVDEAVKIIRGPRGTTVVLTIQRNGWSEPKEFSIVRDIIQIPTIDFEMKEDNIAYFHLYNFYENAPFLFYQSAIKAAMQNPKGVILDLRNNPGGYLEASVNLAGWFLEPGELVVAEEFGSGKKEEFRANNSGFFKDSPIVVLINEGSASASEILAGALRDNRGIKLIGKKSFGKGTVQELERLRDGSSIKITVAHWLMPNGGLIEKNGIAPDYEVNITEEDVKAGRDPQLEKAMEVLKQLITTNQ
ncbi:S41 family peptidase [Candidatus Wolfebacteria bacterium CG02_land_8_20_14_3_00_37_12]|uniref:S41 family peptidase n=1 Tax=Candidatus Wolfebacteria bacterium CG02_land_8_20_14_3_00_37_12 TaxID=1975066 RepID=A0A2M7CQA6_9BACT|nr:MAG: S41 family peptidase [Candidatus Wolfebacteria bacterium CG02_land_8_20_14_3_00_37_12]